MSCKKYRLSIKMGGVTWVYRFRYISEVGKQVEWALRMNSSINPDEKIEIEIEVLSDV